MSLFKKNKEINRVVLIPIAEITRSPNQPRKHFDADELDELSRSIAANGLLQPVTLRKLKSGKFELVAGERRIMAYKTLGRGTIPAIVEDYSDKQSAVFTLIENLQRRDLNYFEEAMGIAKLMQDLQLTQQQVSQQLGKAQSTIANKVRLLRLSPAVQEKMLESGMSERHARALLKIPDEAMQLEIIEYILSHNLNVAQTEQYIDRIYENGVKPTANRMFIVKDMRIFLNTIDKAVSMMNHAGIPVNTEKNENEEFLEYTIRVPKSSVYKEGKDAKKQVQTV